MFVFTPEARAVSAGDVDTSFGTNGVASVAAPAGSSATSYDIEVQTDGKLLVSGTLQNGNEDLCAVARFQPSGAIDPSFGDNGVFTTNHGCGAFLAIQSDGTIVSSGRDASVAITPGGQLDTSFGGNGVSPYAGRLVLQPDDRILLVDGGGVRRLTPDGQPDPTFREDDAAYEGVEAVDAAVAANGDVLIGGRDRNGSSFLSGWRFARLESDGSLDTSFGDSGLTAVAAPLGEEWRSVLNVELQADGKLLVYGPAAPEATGTGRLVRLTRSGQLDSDYGGGDGMTELPSSGVAVWGGLILGADYKATVFGLDDRTNEGGTFEPYLARMNPDGALDGSFGTGGISYTAQGNSGGQLHQLASDRDGKLLLAGNRDPNSNSNFTVTRYESLSGPPPPPPPPPPVLRSYVALGDSVAAGEGLNYGLVRSDLDGDGVGDFWKTDLDRRRPWDQTFTPEACHQSSDAHPRLLASWLSTSLKHFACTGASAKNGVLDAQAGKGVPPQLGTTADGYGPPNLVYDQANPDLVTLSLGANDINFGDRIIDCAKPRVKDGLFADCLTDQTFLTDIENDLASQRARLSDVLVEIKSRATSVGRAPPAVFVTGYADPFPPDGGTCLGLASVSEQDFGRAFSAAEQAFMRNTLTFLNNNIRQVARAKGAHYVPPPTAFRNHTFCSADPWTYDLSALVIDGDGEVRSQAPFHPTPEGQEELARGLSAAIREARPTPSGTDVTTWLPSGVKVGYAGVTGPGSTLAVSEEEGAFIPAMSTFRSYYAFDLSTTAEHTGPITIQVPSDRALSLYHYKDGAWVKLQSTYTDGYVTATVSSLSPFALGEPAPEVTAVFNSSGAGQSPAEVSFDATSSSIEGGGTPAAFKWDFGDGSTGTGATQAHTYETEGTYEVSVRVSSEQGSYDVARGEVKITNPPPVAQLTGPTSLEQGEEGSFSSAGSNDPNGQISGAVWDFGDGTAAEPGESVTHTFDAPGNYIVTLAVLDEEGASDTVTAQVEVVDTAAPETTIDSGPQGPTANNDPSFAFSSTEANSSFECRLDGPGSATGSFASCTSPKSYTDLADGSYSFQVRATDQAANTDQSSASRSFTVDTQAPDTQITKAPKRRTRDRTPTLRFDAVGETAVSFECSIDKDPFSPCQSPITTRKLSYGRHSFKVRSVDAAGNADASPARAKFRVVRR